MKKIVIIATAGFLFACNNSKTEEDKSATERPAAPATSRADGCFTQMTDKDTVTLHLHFVADSVTGDLRYDLFEKDLNQGTIRGALRGDTLLAEYLFQSEGVQSSRQVAFLRRGDDWVEGFGDVSERDGGMVFSDPGRLVFSDSLKLRRIDCQP